jgi:DnaK suppressor protein
MKKQLIDQSLIKECRNKLVLLREDLLNRMRSARLDITIQDKMSGDEVDQTLAQNIENEFAAQQSRVRAQLLEVELALSRIQKGLFGICEETNEPIEEARLRTMPYTRLSIEGAEFREATAKRFAR